MSPSGARGDARGNGVVEIAAGTAASGTQERLLDL
jgi:hypothetical protein